MSLNRDQGQAKRTEEKDGGYVKIDPNDRLFVTKQPQEQLSEIRGQLLLYKVKLEAYGLPGRYQVNKLGYER